MLGPLVPLLKGGRSTRKKMVFQNDGASCHSAQKTQLFLTANNVSVLEWPSQSPDLNIIENIWAVMARQLRGHRFPTRDFLSVHVAPLFPRGMMFFLCEKEAFFGLWLQGKEKHKSRVRQINLEQRAFSVSLEKYL